MWVHCVSKSINDNHLTGEVNGRNNHRLGVREVEKAKETIMNPPQKLIEDIVSNPLAAPPTKRNLQMEQFVYKGHCVEV